MPTFHVEVDGEGSLERAWHNEITATVFGGEGDEQETAYGGWVDGDATGVALPYKCSATAQPNTAVAVPADVPNWMRSQRVGPL